MVFDKLNILPLTNETLWWEISRQDDNLAEHFTKREWEYMFGESFSEIDLLNFTNDFPYYIRSYTLKRNRGEAVGFVYILADINKKSTISIHGGGWANAQINYIGYIMILDALLKCGVKVKTSCASSNNIAIRFSRSVGFVPYRYTNTTIYMWINEKRLKNSSIYKRFRESYK